MYEVEIKVELTDAERQELRTALTEKGFSATKVTPQADYYVEVKDSPYGGRDLKRYRDEDGKLIYTEKIWEKHNGELARKENEREVTQEEFNEARAKYSKVPFIKKQREWFKGSYKNIPISFTIDTVELSNSKKNRYFVEAEIDVKDINEVSKTKEFLKGFLKDLLKKSEIIEAPGMASLAMSLMKGV